MKLHFASTTYPVPLFKAVIFDMDGVLIDSEPLWRRAEQQVFEQVGLTLTEEMCDETTGVRIDEVVAYWYERHPWEGKSQDAIVEEILATLHELIRDEGEALPGAHAALDAIADSPLRLALATSSPHTIIDAVLDGLGLRHYFEVICSAIDEEKGKPDPAVYLHTAHKLGVAPEACIAIEDSAPGVQSARAAGMFTVAVPASEHYNDTTFDEADLKIPSLTDFSIDLIASSTA